MNDFFCSIGRKLSDDIPQQPNPLLSNEYNINEEGTSFQFKTIFSVSVENALKKVKTSFGFESDEHRRILFLSNQRICYGAVWPIRSLEMTMDYAGVSVILQK